MKRPSSPTIRRLRITRDGFALVLGCKNGHKNSIYSKEEVYDANFKILGIFSNRSGSDVMLSFDNLSNTFCDVGRT